MGLFSFVYGIFRMPSSLTSCRMPECQFRSPGFVQVGEDLTHEAPLGFAMRQMANHVLTDDLLGAGLRGRLEDAPHADSLPVV